MEAKNTMRKVSVVLAGLLLFTNYSYADDHSTTALDQANLAIKEGSAGNASNLVKYASRALDKTLGRFKQTTQKFHRILTNPLFYKV
jgi:hypothetical protein